VDSVARTLERARALICPVWHERIGKGEKEIPAVRAPDGTLVYLVEPESGGRSFWEDDVDLLPPADDPGILDDIDHVVLALPTGRMATYILFWRGLFGLVAQTQLDTSDPYGLVHSRALISPNAKVRIVLNASESNVTTTGRFVSAYSGAGVHHVAFSTPDIERTARDYEAHDASLLALPANYYDDLSARWGVDDAALTALQQHALLYDRDDSGEFWHLYTNAFHDRFFFEAVQRKSGYGGFGAPNAPVRAAAQARQQPFTANMS
jgi:4-hydroxyphenylpyruvate dioxygenase